MAACTIDLWIRVLARFHRDTFAENSNTRTPLLASAELSNSERVVGIVVDYARQRPLNQSD